MAACSCTLVTVNVERSKALRCPVLHGLGATLGAKRTNDIALCWTSMDSRQERPRGRELIRTGPDARAWNYGSERLQFGLQFNAVRCRTPRTGQARWSSLNRSESQRSELLMRRSSRKFGAKRPPEAHGVRSACDSGWRTTVTQGQLR